VQILMILMQILMHTLARHKCNFVQYIHTLKQSCNVTRQVSSRDAIFKVSARRSEVSISSRHFEVLGNGLGMSRETFESVVFFNSMELFQHPIMPNAILFKGYLIMYNQWFCDAQ